MSESDQNPDATPNALTPYDDTLPLLALTSGVVLPGMVITMALETDDARAAVDAATSADGRLLLVPKVEGRYARVGTISVIEESGRLPSGVHGLVVRGLQRARIGAGVPGTGSALWVQIEPVEETSGGDDVAELAREYRAVTENILELRGAARFVEMLPGVDEPGALADASGYSPDLDFAQKVQVLESVDVAQRLQLVLDWARETLGDLTLRQRIRTDVEEGMEKTQREFLLRRQMDAIRKELGELDGSGDGGVEDHRARAAAADLPEDVRAAVDRELDKLERTSEQSPEHGWIRTWLDTVLELPWGVTSEDRLDVAEAARILDEDHDGLDDVKERVLEHLAVRKLRAERGLVAVDGRGAGAILALVGPPGVGKTSLGESIARALGRSFVRVALGGVRDEAEIRGHRRTYVGAQPGRLVRAIREAGTMNPVVLLDEVDKLGADLRGDPSAALLEVLDPAQNHTFADHYLEVDLDLSQVMFVATANVLETIPAPLLDRLEIISLDGYVEDEKVGIARHHLLGRQLERVGLRPDEVEVHDDALRVIVADHTREAGVRSLERTLGRLLRKIATKLASGEVEAPVVVGAQDVPTWLGRAKFFFEAADRTSVPGVATGLAVTGTGGDVLFVEATAMAGTPGLTLTGQLGDVMKESAEIALSYLRSHADALGIDAADFDRRFHVHVPAGAVPKDGPSAGVTMTTALVSLLTGRAVRPVVGMTGEVTLQGKVLPIGGVRQKVLAAHRAGLTEVVLPERNRGDLDDVPQAVRDEMTFHLASHIDQVLDAALAPTADAGADSAPSRAPGSDAAAGPLHDAA
jgi:ATP-dependent Lon protease